MIYFSGDTDVMADMEWFGDYYKPDIGILSAGGPFTMNMGKADYAAEGGCDRTRGDENHRNLAFGGEKVLQQRLAFARRNALVNLGPVVALGVVKHPRPLGNATRFRI